MREIITDKKELTSKIMREIITDKIIFTEVLRKI